MRTKVGKVWGVWGNLFCSLLWRHKIPVWTFSGYKYTNTNLFVPSSDVTKFRFEQWAAPEIAQGWVQCTAGDHQGRGEPSSPSSSRERSRWSSRWSSRERRTREKQQSRRWPSSITMEESRSWSWSEKCIQCTPCVHWINVNINVRRVYIYNYSPSLTSRNFSSFFEQIERLAFQLWKQKWHYQLCRLSTFKMHQLLDVATYLPQTSTHITHNGMGVTKSFKTWWNVCWGSQAAGANPQRTSHIILIQRRIDFKKTARDALEANWCEKHCRSTILRELAAFSVSRKFESLFSTPPCSLKLPEIKNLSPQYVASIESQRGKWRQKMECLLLKRKASLFASGDSDARRCYSFG